jgi:tol-pal system protein YbgF
MFKLPQFRLAAVALAFAAWMPLHASAGLLDDDEARRAILDLRTKLEALSQRVDSRIETKADKSSMVDILNQHEQTMQEIARLRGQIEVLGNQIANAQKNQKDLYADLDSRIKKLEPRQETVDGQAVEVMPSEKVTYDSAMKQFQSGDYQGAAGALQDFMRRYPTSAYAPNAQYLLGNAYYAQKDYKSAISTLQGVVQNYGTSPKAADAMLTIGSSYTEMKDKKAAKKVLQQLVAKYPGSSAAQTAKDRLAALR